MSSLRKLPLPLTKSPLAGSLRFAQLHRLMASVPLSMGLAASLAIAAGTWSAPKVEAQGTGTNFGSVNVCAPGMSSPAPCSSSLLVQMTFGAVSGTPVAPQALTAGAPSPDLTIVGSTCVIAGPVPPAVGCLVHVIFSPKFAGLRAGAIVVPDSTGGVLATTLVTGVGLGPQIAFGPVSAVALGSTFSQPNGIAIDGTGNVFFLDDPSLDPANYELRELLAAGGYTTVNTLASGFNFPSGLALDGSGNVFVAASLNNEIKEVLAVGGYTTINGIDGTFNQPQGVAVDGSGNLFVADTLNKAVKEVLAAGGYTTVKTLAGSFTNPTALALDSNGNVFVCDSSAGTITEILAAGGYVNTSPLVGGLENPTSVGVDAGGNIYFTDQSKSVKELLAAGSYATVVSLSDDFSEPVRVAVDALGNVFVADFASGALKELTRSQPPSLSFATTGIGNTSSDSPQSIQIQNIGNQALSAASPGLTVSTNFDQVAGSGTPDDCTSSFSLMPGAECNISVSFEPTAIGDLTGTVTLTDNALNSSATTQSIQLSGTGSLAVPIIQWATPAAITYGTPLSATQLDATSSVAGTFAYTPALGATLSAGPQTLMTAFTPTNTTDYTTASSTVTLTVNQATPTITWPTPTAITYGTPLSATQLDATSSVAGTFVYTPALGATLSAGAQTLKATFTPTDTIDYTSASSTVTLTVSQATPTITWPAPAAITYGTPLSATQLNATTAVAGTFAYTPTLGATLAAGPQTLKTTFTPTDTTDYTTASSTVTLTVNQATPTITWPTPAAIAYGTALSATQLDATSTVAGTFAYTPALGATLAAGPQTLKTAFTPTDTTDYTTASSTVTLTVNQAPQTIQFSGLPAVATYGAAGPYTLGATASSGLPIAYTVTGPGSVSGSVLTVNGAGTLAVTASQPGNAGYAAATPVTLSISVAPATSGTSIASSVSSITYGGSVMLTATVTSSAGTPSGMVTFTNGATVLGTGALNAGGTASLTTAALPVGSDVLGASYSASASYLASSSPAVTVTVNPVASSTALTASAATTIIGGNVTLTATVTSTVGTPAGTVTFSNGSTVFGTGTLDAGGVASLTTNALPLGNNALLAGYSGGGNFAPSTSYPIALLVSLIPTTTSLVSSGATADVGTTVTLTATVADSSGSIVPTGMVSFSDGGTVLGSPSVDGNGIATFSTSSLAAGTHAILASYAGDAIHATSTSTVLLETISTPSGPGGSGFTISASTNSLSIVQGQTGTAVLTLTASNSSSSSVTLTCSGLPKSSNCTFSPASVTPTTAGAASTLIIGTDASSSSAGLKMDRPRGPASPETLTTLAGIGLSGFVLFWGMADRKRIRRSFRLHSAVLTLCLGGVLASMLLGCGGGGGGSSKTPTGLYQVSIVATGSSNGMTATQTILLYLTITK
jgi:hypothetical protein